MQRHRGRENETLPALDATHSEVFHLTTNQTCMSKAADQIPTCLSQNLFFCQGDSQRKTFKCITVIKHQRRITQNTEHTFFNIIYNLISRINVNYIVNIIWILKLPKIMNSLVLTRAIPVLFLGHNNSSDLNKYWFCTVCNYFHFFKFAQKLEMFVSDSHLIFWHRENLGNEKIFKLSQFVYVAKWSIFGNVPWFSCGSTFNITQNAQRNIPKSFCQIMCPRWLSDQHQNYE